MGVDPKKALNIVKQGTKWLTYSRDDGWSLQFGTKDWFSLVLGILSLVWSFVLATK